MVDFNNFSLMSQLPKGGPSFQAPAQPAPQPAPQQRMPGLLGLLFNIFNKPKAPSASDKAVIDRRPDEMQQLVSMFNRGPQ